jgi:hypothetical protein
MSDEKEKCLCALADFIKSNSVGWCFRVPLLYKTGEETIHVPGDAYLPCLGSPLGLSTDTLVEGLICLNFLTLTKNECKINKDAWENFRTNYMLGNLLEIEASTLMRNEGVRQRHYYVKLGSTSCCSASSCIATAKADRHFRIPRRLGSPTKRREFVNALTELLLVDMDDARIDSWLISADLPDGKGKEDGDDDGKDGDGMDGDGKDGDGKDDGGNQHSADGVAQGVSSDLIGATDDALERSKSNIVDLRHEIIPFTVLGT